MYDGLVSRGATTNYKLNSSRDYRLLRASKLPATKQPKGDLDNNTIKYRKLREFFVELEFSEAQIDTIHAIVAAILNLGESRYVQNI